MTEDKVVEAISRAMGRAEQKVLALAEMDDYLATAEALKGYVLLKAGWETLTKVNSFPKMATERRQ